MPIWVELATSPPSAATDPQLVSPMPMALPALPPLLTSPSETAPPLAADVATPPLPAEAVSMNCMMVSPPLYHPWWTAFDHPQAGGPQPSPHADSIN